MKRLLFLLLIVLYLLHNDIWLWNNSTLIAGLPAGMLYHILFCVASFILLWLIVRFAWPQHLEVDGEPEK